MKSKLDYPRKAALFGPAAVVHKPEPVVHIEPAEVVHKKSRYADPEARKAYRREWMRKKRAADSCG